LDQYIGDDKLKIDTALAHKWIEFNCSNQKKKDERAEKKASLYKAVVDKINLHPDDCGITDETSKRYHSHLTNAKSQIRNFATYDGHYLTSCDIPNAQPYLSTLLLNEGFYTGRTSTITIYEVMEYNPNLILPNSTKYISTSTKKEVFTSLIYYNQVNKVSSSSINYLIMSGLFTNKDVKYYTEICKSGELYEFMVEELKEAGMICNREEVKMMFMHYLFATDKQMRHWHPEFHACFMKLFPSVHQVFCIIKEKNHNCLAILLQTIESYVVIDLICKQFVSENEGIPVYTLHDNIATLSSVVSYLKGFMEAELEKYIGIPIKLREEEWRPENAYKIRGDKLEK
jgi:hypothetical protein